MHVSVDHCIRLETKLSKSSHIAMRIPAPASCAAQTAGQGQLASKEDCIDKNNPDNMQEHSLNVYVRATGPLSLLNNLRLIMPGSLRVYTRALQSLTTFRCSGMCQITYAIFLWLKCRPNRSMLACPVDSPSDGQPTAAKHGHLGL